MGTASAQLSMVQVGSPGPFRGSPVTLGLLCVLAAAAGAGVGAIFGSHAEQRIDEQRRATSLAEHAATLRNHRDEQQEMQAQLDELERIGVLQEARDLEEADELGLPRALEQDLLRMSGDDGRRVLAALVREGRRNGLDPLFLAAVIRVETHFDPYARSNAGARGLMQLMPATAVELASRRGFRVTAGQLYNPVLNIELGAAYLRNLIERFGDARSALIAYNAGPSLVRNAHLSPGVRAYPRNVLAQYARLSWQARKSAEGSPATLATAAR
jgi:soluble lytic murein transglycosylase-like protein